MARSPFYIDARFVITRDAEGSLRDLKGRLVKANRAVAQIYRVSTKSFLERAAEELYNIPSAARYRAWHQGKASVSPVSRDISLANALTNSRNLRREENQNTISYRALSTAYMNRTAPHWAAIEYGSSQNVRNAAGRLIRFFEPGETAKLVKPGPSRVGRGVLLRAPTPGSVKTNRRKVISRKGSVRQPIRPGLYLDRAYNAVLGPEFGGRLARRFRGLFGTR